MSPSLLASQQHEAEASTQVLALLVLPLALRYAVTNRVTWCEVASRDMSTHALCVFACLLVLCRNVRDPANAALVNSDPELQQWVRNVKMTAEDVRSKMRNTAAPLFAAQVRHLVVGLLAPLHGSAQMFGRTTLLFPDGCKAARSNMHRSHCKTHCDCPSATSNLQRCATLCCTRCR